MAERTVGEESVAIARTYATGIDDLWDACTNPERIPRWFLPVSGDLRAGGQYSLAGNASGTIEKCDPPHGFRITWESMGEVSQLELRLSAVDADNTRFELIHTGLGGSRWDEFGPGAVGVGWDGALYGLELYLAGGAMPDPSWIQSDEAKRFYRESGLAWRDAHLAAGAPDEIAQASADRTIAAYTG